MPNFFAQLPAGATGETIARVVGHIQRKPIACERPASIDGHYLLIDFGGHHTNELILAMLAGLADPAGAEAAQANIWRLPKLIDLVSSIDEHQKQAITAFAHLRGEPLTLYEAIYTLIEAESLHAYFEHEDGHHDDPKHRHHSIRPAGYAAHSRQMRENEDAPDWDVFDELRKKAQGEKLDEPRRVALVAILAIYNSQLTGEHFKGRGWTLRAGALGRYLRRRIDSDPLTFDAFVSALAVYPGW